MAQHSARRLRRDWSAMPLDAVLRSCRIGAVAPPRGRAAHRPSVPVPVSATADTVELHIVAPPMLTVILGGAA